MRPIQIHAKTISDAWFQLLYNIFDGSYRQTIQKGSFENEQYRLQYPGASVYIECPEQDIVPVIPAALNIPSPTTMEYIESYFAGYLMDPALAENETYTYGSRICQEVMQVRPNVGMGPTRSQLGWIIKMLKETPLTNQAVIEIATPSDVATCYGKDGKLDPPCLRVIDFKVVPKPSGDMVLTVTVYFRSWDLWAGFPSNLGGLELLKQYVAHEAGLINGPMYAYSAGLHIYGYQEEIARIRTMKAVPR